jgi:hypothetical protein
MRCRVVPEFVLAVGLFASSAWAHDIITTNLTFSRDVSRILARHCGACHGPGTSIPLTTYAEVRPWAVSIKEQVLSRTMPPWGAVKGFGDFSPDGGLSQEDILIIAAWVVGGAPAGDPHLLPKGISSSSVQASPPSLKDAIAIATREELKTPLHVAAIRPQSSAPVRSCRVVAHLPDGRIEPLLWLYHFDPKFPQTFRFRRPVDLPAGTIVESSGPLQFTLETLTKDPSQGS